MWKGGVSCRQLATQQWRKRYNPDTEGADGETAGNFLETVLTVCCQEHRDSSGINCLLVSMSVGQLVQGAWENRPHQASPTARLLDCVWLCLESTGHSPWSLAHFFLSESDNHSVVPDCLRPHGLEPAKLCPWDPPGKHTGVVAISYSRGSSQPRDWTLLHWKADSLPLQHLGSHKYKTPLMWFVQRTAGLSSLQNFVLNIAYLFHAV